MAPAHRRGDGGARQGEAKAATSPLDCLSAEFWAEARAGSPLPPPDLPEVAFAGRSNVGKSTLLNRIVQRNALARTSRTPGCTRGVVLFTVRLRDDTRFVLADLPGYGFAQRSHGERREWAGHIEQYLQRRASLRAVALLVDARRGVETEELQLAEWLQHIHRDAFAVVTKVDKLARPERAKAVAAVERAFGFAAIPVSGETGEGRDALVRRLRAIVRPVEPTIPDSSGETQLGTTPSEGSDAGSAVSTGSEAQG